MQSLRVIIAKFGREFSQSLAGQFACTFKSEKGNDVLVLALHFARFCAFLYRSFSNSQ